MVASSQSVGRGAAHRTGRQVIWSITSYRRPLVLPLHGRHARLRPLPQPVVHAQAAEEAAEEGEPDEEGDEGGVAQQDFGLLFLQVVEALLPRPLQVREG